MRRKNALPERKPRRRSDLGRKRRLESLLKRLLKKRELGKRRKKLRDSVRLNSWLLRNSKSVMKKPPEKLKKKELLRRKLLKKLPRPNLRQLPKKDRVQIADAQAPTTLDLTALAK